MTYIKYFLTAINILSLTLLGCSNPNRRIFLNAESKTRDYCIAQQKLKDGDWKNAIIKLEELDDFHQFNPYLQQIQLDLIYAYYKNVDLLSAQTAISRFIRLNPTHRNIDYVIYMSGLTNMALDNITIYSLFGIDRSDRDPQHARDAFSDFTKLVYNYPNSRYNTDAIKRLIFLKNRLAKYEYSIAKYYYLKGAWIAVINRVEDMLKNYPDTKAASDGLRLMEDAYRNMHMNKQADKVKKIINANDINY